MDHEFGKSAVGKSMDSGAHVFFERAYRAFDLRDMFISRYYMHGKRVQVRSCTGEFVVGMEGLDNKTASRVGSDDGTEERGHGGLRPAGHRNGV